MKFSEYKQKVESSEEFKKFKQENPDSYLCAGFFVFDYETKDNKKQAVDYSIKDGEIATFDIATDENNQEKIIKKISEKAIKKSKIKEIKETAKTDLEALKEIVEDEMKNKMITGNIKKMIIVLQMLNNDLIWNIQAILSGMEIINIHIDDSDKSVLKFEKFSLRDIIRKK